MRQMIVAASILGFFMFSSATEPTHKGMCNISISKAYTQNIRGKNIGYYVEFKNNFSHTVEGLKWKTTFYDNFDDQKGMREGSWSPGNFVSPLAPNSKAIDLESNWLNYLTKVRITIVHFTDSMMCD